MSQSADSTGVTPGIPTSIGQEAIIYTIDLPVFVIIVVVLSRIFNVNIITPTSRGDILRQLFHQSIPHESNAWRKRCVFRPDLKTGKEQGARRWSANVFHSLGGAALKAAAAEE